MSPARQRVAPTPVSGFRSWCVVILLTVCYALSFIDRQILSLLVTPLKADLLLNDTQVGLLQGLAFTALYTILGLPAGRLADTTNRRNLIGLSVFTWSLFTGLCAAATGFRSLFLARFGVGMGEAGLMPASYSLLADYFSRERLAQVLSIFYMGAFFGSSLALIVGGTVVDRVTRLHSVTLPLLGTIASWRATFWIVGVPGLLIAFLVFAIREPRRYGRSEENGRTLTLRETGACLWLRWQSFIGLSVGIAFQATCLYGFLAWAPTFLFRNYHWTPGQAGRALGLAVGVLGCAGVWAGGRWSRYLHGKGVLDASLKVTLISALGTGVLFPAGFLSRDIHWSLPCLFAGVFFVALPTGTAVAALQAVLPSRIRGQGSALFLFILNLVGLTLGPLMPGLLNDYFFRDSAMLGSSVAVTLGVACILMFLTILWASRFYPAHYRALTAELTDFRQPELR